MPSYGTKGIWGSLRASLDAEFAQRTACREDNGRVRNWGSGPVPHSHSGSAMQAALMGLGPPGTVAHP